MLLRNVQVAGCDEGSLVGVASRAVQRGDVDKTMEKATPIRFVEVAFGR